MNTLRIEKKKHVQYVWLNRPTVRNAFDDVLVRELTQVFTRLDADVRAVVLAGEGEAFCAGADLGWMQRSVDYTVEENRRDAQALAAMFRAIDESTRPVIARVHGAALGGALGLIACCDAAVATDTARFGFTEVRLGLVPAVIAPFVMSKIGQSAARRYFVTGELFDASVALRMGLVHEVVAPPQLDAAVTQIVDNVCKAGPQAVGEAKAFLRAISESDRAVALDGAVATIARLRVSAEGQEGLRAFLEKRVPSWQVPS